MALLLPSSCLLKTSRTQSAEDFLEGRTCKREIILQQIYSRITLCDEDNLLRLATDKQDHQRVYSCLSADDGKPSRISRCKYDNVQLDDIPHEQSSPFDDGNSLLTCRTDMALQAPIHREIPAKNYPRGQSFPSKNPLPMSKIMADKDSHSPNKLLAEHDEENFSRMALDADTQVHRELSAKDHQSGPLLTKLEIASLLQNGNATLEDAKLIHDHIARHGPPIDVYLGNLFISLYGKHGAVIEARSVFDSMPERSVVSWNAMIAAYSQQGFAKEALQLFQHMQQEGITAVEATFVSAVNACAELLDLTQGKILHKMITDSLILPNSFVQTALINMYGKCGALQEAKLVFDDIHPHDVVSWTSIISAYSHHGHGEESLQLFEQMQEEGIVPNIITFVSVVSSFENPVLLENGKLIHLHIINEGLESDVIVATALINMYSKCGDIECASSLFRKLHCRNIVSWSAMVGAFVEHGCSNTALQLFQVMQMEGIKPNKVTLLHALDACGDMVALAQGQTIYTSIIQWGMESDVVLGTSIINMFHQCGAMEDALAVFDRIHDRNVIVWNSMIGTYAQQGCGEEVLNLFRLMQQEGIKPDDFTFLSVLSACASLNVLEVGETTHACIIDGGFEVNTVVGTGLINMYGKCKNLRESCILFNKIVVLDTICFNALIGAFVQQGKDKDAMQLYNEMLKKGFKPDEVTYVNILSACANLAARLEGEVIHASIIDSGYNVAVHIANALMNMYGSCGDLNRAFLIFNQMRIRDVVSWNALIAVLTQQGHAHEALQVFQKMELERVMPNSVTLVSILAACSRAGLVKEAQGYFSSMSKDYGIAPTIEHCRCMIDLFARAGQLNDAENFITHSQLRTNVLAWMSLLSACRLYGDIERGIRTAEIAINLDPQTPTPFVLLLNIYAGAGRWDDVEKVKQRMIEKGLKDPCIDVDECPDNEKEQKVIGLRMKEMKAVK